MMTTRWDRMSAGHAWSVTITIKRIVPVSDHQRGGELGLRSARSAERPAQPVPAWRAGQHGNPNKTPAESDDSRASGGRRLSLGSGDYTGKIESDRVPVLSANESTSIFSVRRMLRYMFDIRLSG